MLVCMPDRVGQSPIEMMDVMLGSLLSDLNPGIAELLDSQASMGTSQLYNFFLPQEIACILLLHETGHCLAPGGTQDPLHQADNGYSDFVLLPNLHTLSTCCRGYTHLDTPDVSVRFRFFWFTCLFVFYFCVFNITLPCLLGEKTRKMQVAPSLVLCCLECQEVSTGPTTGCRVLR